MEEGGEHHDDGEGEMTRVVHLILDVTNNMISRRHERHYR